MSIATVLPTKPRFKQYIIPYAISGLFFGGFFGYLFVLLIAGPAIYFIGGSIRELYASTDILEYVIVFISMIFGILIGINRGITRAKSLKVRK